MSSMGERIAETPCGTLFINHQDALKPSNKGKYKEKGISIVRRYIKNKKS